MTDQHREIHSPVDAIEMLEAILGAASAEERRRAITMFQRSVQDPAELTARENVDELLSDLALDLDYYVADARSRAEDPSFYGEERLQEEILTGVAALRKLAGE